MSQWNRHYRYSAVTTGIIWGVISAAFIWFSWLMAIWAVQNMLGLN